MDEPFAAVDAATEQAIVDVLKELATAAAPASSSTTTWPPCRIISTGLSC
jgi:ABC-type nitrate/sulfonate/bicarbonate transport system ATPase subunit